MGHPCLWHIRTLLGKVALMWDTPCRVDNGTFSDMHRPAKCGESASKQDSLVPMCTNLRATFHSTQLLLCFPSSLPFPHLFLLSLYYLSMFHLFLSLPKCTFLSSFLYMSMSDFFTCQCLIPPLYIQTQCINSFCAI